MNIRTLSFKIGTAQREKNAINEMQGLTLLIHLYYPGSWQIIQEKCAYAIGLASQIIITVCHDDVMPAKDLPENFTILKVPNQGKDIGGKLVSMSYYLNFCKKTDYIVFLHDKISPQTINADYWLEKLYSIFGKNLFAKAIYALGNNKKTGVIGSKAFLKNEFLSSEQRFATTNDKILRQLISRYALSCKKYDFVAGTIFIARSNIFESFFGRFPALDAREKLEQGNVLDLAQGTYTHSWERLLCFIAQDQGYNIKGI